MKRLQKILTTLALILTLFATTGLVMAEETPFGSSSALDDECLTLDKMLTYAIQDEYAAEAEYHKIIETYGTVRPYTNIVKAETQHIRKLTPLFEANGLALPVNDALNHIVLPTSLKESYTIGVDAEIKNIEMYDHFLKEDLPEDVRTVFEALQAASEKHLAAFERNASKTGNTRKSQ